MAAVFAVGLGDCATDVPTRPPDTPRPTADPARAVAALDKFQALLKDPKMSMHIEQTTSVGVGEGSATVNRTYNYRMDISGRDFAATMFILKETIEFRSVGGDTYGKAEKGAWTAVPLEQVQIDEILNPWYCLGDVEALQVLTYTFNPRESFIFGNTGPIDYSNVAMRAEGYTGQIDSLRFTVTSDGKPVEVSFSGEAPTSAGRVKLGSTLKASRVGDPIVVENPVP